MGQEPDGIPHPKGLAATTALCEVTISDPVRAFFVGAHKSLVTIFCEGQITRTQRAITDLSDSNRSSAFELSALLVFRQICTMTTRWYESQPSPELVEGLPPPVSFEPVFIVIASTKSTQRLPKRVRPILACDVTARAVVSTF